MTTWASMLRVAYRTRSKRPGPCKVSFQLASFFWRFRRCRLMVRSDLAIPWIIGSKMLVTNYQPTRCTRPRLSYHMSPTQPWTLTRVRGRKKSCVTSSSLLWTASRTTASKRRTLAFVSKLSYHPFSFIFYIQHIFLLLNVFYFNFIFCMN